MDEPKSPPASPPDSPPPPPPAPHPEERRRAVGRIISIVIIFGAMVMILCVWAIIERHPRTDDATVQANVIGVAPRVRGQIIKLNVQDNQQVQQGDVLFEIDPEDYK